MQLARPFYEELRGDASIEYAELVNSLGESLLELKAFDAARDAFDAAHKAVVESSGADDASASSIEANQAKLLSHIGEEEAARQLFAHALDVIRQCVRQAEEEEAKAPAGEATNHLFLCQVIHARVLKLCAEFEESCGESDSASLKLKEVKRLETNFGFFSQ